MAFTYLVSVGASDDVNSSTTPPIDTTGANLLIVSITYLSAVAAPTVSDNKSNTWSVAHNSSDGTISHHQLKCLTPTVGTGHTFTVSGTASAPSIAVIALSVGGGTSSQDQANDNGTASPGSITPTQPNEVCITSCGTAPGVTAANTCSGGYTVDVSEEFGFSGCTGVSLAHLIQTTAVATSPTWSGGTGTPAAAVIVSYQIGSGTTNTPLNGAAAAVTVAASTAVLALREPGSPGAVTVAAFTAVLALREPGSPGAVTVAGSAALLTGGVGALPASVAVSSRPAALRTGVGALPESVTVSGRPAALRMGVGDAPGVIAVVGFSAELRRSAENPPGRVVVTGSPALLVALSPPGPPPPPPPTPVTGGTRRAARRRVPVQQVYGTIPPWIGDGPGV